MFSTELVDGKPRTSCSACKEAGRVHEVIGIPANLRSPWGALIPVTYRKCTGCGFDDAVEVGAARE